MPAVFACTHAICSPHVPAPLDASVVQTACVHEGCSQYHTSHAEHAAVSACVATNAHAPSSPSASPQSSPALFCTHVMCSPHV